MDLRAERWPRWVGPQVRGPDGTCNCPSYRKVSVSVVGWAMGPSDWRPTPWLERSAVPPRRPFLPRTRSLQAVPYRSPVGMSDDQDATVRQHLQAALTMRRVLWTTRASCGLLSYVWADRDRTVSEMFLYGLFAFLGGRFFLQPVAGRIRAVGE